MPSHRIRARLAATADAPQIATDPAIVSSFLSDAAHVPGGFAPGVAFPATELDVASLVSRASHVLPIGAQSSLTGGATPRGELLLSTRGLTRVEIIEGREVRAGAGVTLADLQRDLAIAGLYYPPVPTYDGATVGGTISTNAAGAATFKYGSTRPWVSAITVVLADGAILDIRRGEVTASPQGTFEIVGAGFSQPEEPHVGAGFSRPEAPYVGAGFSRPEAVTILHIPTYTMPDVPKLSAGYFARPEMDLIDLFIGSEGTLGVIVDATLRVIPRPHRNVLLVVCADEAQAIAVTAALRDEARAAWNGDHGLDVAAIEYIDAHALAALSDDAFRRAAVPRPALGCTMLLVQIEVAADQEEMALVRTLGLLNRAGVALDPYVAAIDDDRAAQRLFDLREAVPASVNALVASAKTHVHADIEKTAGDMIVPFNRLPDALALYRQEFERRGLDYAIWGHASDGNLHPNVVPRSLEDVERGREAILAMARGVVRMGGAPLAEHGVGRSALKQRLLLELYGESGIDDMRRVKRALDPTWKLAPGVVFPPRGSEE